MSSRYCAICDRWFPHANALFQHLRDSSVDHPCCNVCGMSFGSSRALKAHCDQEHYYCDGCEEAFSDEDEFIEHGEEYHFVCVGCVRIFWTHDALANHNDSKHYYCRECDRLFMNANNLAAHRASSRHTPRSFKCPGWSCGRAFVSISALILHAESGTCPSGVTRKIINTRMSRFDTQHVITNPGRMITGGEESEYWATKRSWNGFGYECIICQAVFGTLYSLNQHLKSPCHEQPFYHCPKRSCNLQFIALSALCQHVEWGSCGARQTRLVQDAAGRLTRSMRTIAL